MPDDDDMEPEEWPRTVDQAVDDLLEHLSPDDRERVRATLEEDLILFHHGWGTGIRNSFGLWRGNAELLADCGGGHPDNASMVIIKAVWRRLREV